MELRGSAAQAELVLDFVCIPVRSFSRQTRLAIRKSSPLFPNSIRLQLAAMASNRIKAQIRAAVEAGEESQKYASNPGRYLRRGARRIKLLNADGTSTPAGAYY